MITIHQGINWQLKPLFVYRFLEKEHVDDFFNNGVLGLSSFSKFRKHKDEVRSDKSEGSGLYLANYKPENASEKGHSFVALMNTGKNAYVLSTTLKNDISTFGDCEYNSGFKINDVYGFSVEVGRSIRNLLGGMMGRCIYRDPAIIPIDLGKFNIDELTEDQKKLKQQEFFQKCEQDTDIFFIKKEHHQIQMEYRIIWFADRTEEFELIKCPKAREFCESI